MARLSARNFRNAIAFQKTVLGGATFKTDILKFQQEDLAQDAREVVRKYDLKGETEVIGKSGAGRNTIKASEIPHVARRLPFASTTVFNFAGQVDLKKAAAEVLQHLRKLSEPFRLTGQYTSSHRIVGQSGKGLDEVIAISTDVPYAAKLERPKRYFRTGRTYRVYQRTATWAAKKWVGAVHIVLVTAQGGAPSIELMQFKGQSPYSASKAPKWPSKKRRGRRRRKR